MDRPRRSVHRSRWFVAVAKTAFGFVLTGARWARGTYVEVGKDKSARVKGLDGVRYAVRARVERTQSVSAASASTLGMRASSQPMPQHASAGSSSCKQRLQCVDSDDYIEKCRHAAHGQQENKTDVQAASLAETVLCIRNSTRRARGGRPRVRGCLSTRP